MMDNLSTHTTSAVYQTFPAAEERRILRRLEFHYTPKHANWLNMVEIEIGVLCRQCLDRRIASRDSLETEVRTWLRRRTERAIASDGCSQHSTQEPRWQNHIQRHRSTRQEKCVAVFPGKARSTFAGNCVKTKG
ncbi:hypothetical protein HF265_13005 [Rhizobium leguminosarum]|nr:hypothetical protein [Rhizobium leguminosarum]MBY3022630.1 hypothetical protein [Rhizobium leguminosarum]MBY3030013.1 hypothetical protein [Rhizobium leguminosarum]RWX38669.1 hypothetical protein EHI43_04330 [Rhizobium leguminosarum]